MIKDPAQDLEHIRHMMEKSSRFLSLSGLSGVSAGVFALLGAGAAYRLLQDTGAQFANLSSSYPSAVLQQLVLICLLTLLAAFIGAWYFSYRKSRKNKIGLWNAVTRRLLLYFFIPLLAGGLFSLALVAGGSMHLVPSAMLLFYGLGLVNASKYTYSDIIYLGYALLVLGICAAFFPAYGLLFWATGFGVLHILYGIVMYKKYR